MALLSEPAKAAAAETRSAAPSAWQAWRYRLKVALREPTTLIGVLTALLFTYLIVVPIIPSCSTPFACSSGTSGA